MAIDNRPLSANENCGMYLCNFCKQPTQTVQCGSVIRGYDCKECGNHKSNKTPAAKPEKLSVEKQPKTQKAKGFQAIRDLIAEDRVLGKFGHFPESILITGEEDIKRDSAMFPQFARPCPMTPRHGFVDSKLVFSIDEALQLFKLAKEVDADAEMLLQVPIDASHNAIYVPGMLTIGPGNDGATAGKDSVTVSVAGGDIVSDKVKKEAGITDTPYIEAVYNKKGVEDLCKDTIYKESYKFHLTQLRDGPAVTTISTDYIPSELTVREVILASGDLLEWERKTASLSAGAVVYHSGGNIASHYAVHCILHQIPYITSFEPRIGQTVRPTDNSPKPVNLRLWRSGFYSFCERANGEFPLLLSARLMLMGLHNSSRWTGNQDFLLGASMGAAFKLASTLCFGEHRHVERRKGKRRPIFRESIYLNCWVSFRRYRYSLWKMLQDFDSPELWSSGFGGKCWATVAAASVRLYLAAQNLNFTAALRELNLLVNTFHNNGWAFNKLMSDDEMKMAAANIGTYTLAHAPALYETLRIPRSPWKWRTLRTLERLAVREICIKAQDRKYAKRPSPKCGDCAKQEGTCTCRGHRISGYRML